MLALLLPAPPQVAVLHEGVEVECVEGGRLVFSSQCGYAALWSGSVDSPLCFQLVLLFV